MPIEIINLSSAQRSGSTTTTNSGTQEGSAAGRAQSSNHQPDRAGDETEKATYTDTVTFTETATQLQAIANEIADIPVVNTARVEAIQYRLEYDEFEIDTDKLANNILRFETQL